MLGRTLQIMHKPLNPKDFYGSIKAAGFKFC